MSADTTKQMKATGRLAFPLSLHKQPADQVIDYGYSIFDADNTVLVLCDPVPGNEFVLPEIVSALNAQSDTRAALEGARTVLADAIYLFDHPKQSEDEALCIRAMKAAGRTIQAALNPDGEK